MGENIYWSLPGTPGASTADYSVIRAGGMHVSAPNADSTTGSETVAWDGTDEADMDYGPGTTGWNKSSTQYNNSACVPAGSRCGYTAANYFYTGHLANGVPAPHPIDGRAVHQGFGKGVLFWESNQQAAKFLNYTDILSADSYWLTDNDLEAASQGGCALLPHSSTACGGGGGSGLTAAQSHLPANYAYDVTRLEHLQVLNGPSKPIVVDVETGCPSTASGSLCATPPQTIAAAWHALIAGARGIVWFQHNFSGPCIDDRTFIDGSNPANRMYYCQQTPGVTLHTLVRDISRFDHEVASVNDVLLSVTAEGYARTAGVVSTTTKVHSGSCYVFAGSGKPGTPPPTGQSVTFRLADHYTGPVHVYDENRTLRATNGLFSDVFADANTVHIYRIAGSPICSRPTPPS
jgi:hypothetical protein